MIKVVGDICVDVTHNCECNRISPEGPFPILLETDDVEYRLGMVGYVTALLCSLNSKVQVELHSSWQDAPGYVPITRLFEGYSNLRISNHPAKKGIYKHRYYVGQHMVARVDQDCYASLAIKTQNLELLSDDILIFSDYQKGVRLNLGKESPRVKHSIYDPHGATRLNQIHGYTIITPNASEYISLTKQAVEKGCTSITTYLHANDPMERDRYIIHTRGEDGVVLETWNSGKEETTAKKIPPLGICRGKVVDIVGAGDCIVAGLATGLSAGASIEKSLMYGMVVAELAITKKGTAVISRSEIRKYIAELSSRGLL